MLKLISMVALSLLLSTPVMAKAHHKHHKHHKHVHHKHVYTAFNHHLGMASWYGPGFHGHKTASGERFNQNAMTAAHKTLPLGSLVRVTSLETNQSIIVRINDRGPYRRGFIIDLSKGAARALKMSGSDKVQLTVID
jgi:rare lipoprotein A (peptidoglycan hydrolase)